MFNITKKITLINTYARRFTVVGLTLLVSASVMTVNANAADEGDIASIRTELAKIIPQASISEIVSSPVKGVYRLEIQGSYAFAYVQGDYVMLGDLINTQSMVNLGDQASAAKMAEAIKTAPASDMIVFGPKDAKRHITVFTDIDCAYCRKLHNEVGQLVAAGIQVRYLAFPRSGIDTPSYDKFVSVWCSDDRQGSLTAAKSGYPVEAAKCDNPVADNYLLGREVGVSGTPTIIYDDGTVRPGYVPAKNLIQALGMDG